MTTDHRPAIDVRAVMDAARFGGMPLLVMAFAIAVMIVDGFDIQVIGFAAPVIAKEFGIERGALAPALAASLIGMAIGGFTFGPLGDRRGRRPALIGSVLLFGAGTLACATASSVDALTFWRLLTGVGLGGALPNATALIAEFSPPKFRSQAIVASLLGVPLGGMIGAAIAAEIIPVLGWQAIFLIGGAVPIVGSLALFFWLPESPRYLAAQPGSEARLAAILNRIAGAARYGAGDRFVASSGSDVPAVSGARGIFARDMLRDTTALWIIFATNIFGVYCFYNWAPVVLTSLGIDLATAVRGSLVFNTAGLVGAVGVSWLVARYGSRWMQAALGVMASLALLYVGRLVKVAAENAHAAASAAPPILELMVGFAIAGAGIVSIQATTYAVSAHVYPTACRSAGVGWAQGMGRLGGVLSAFVGAALLKQTGAPGFFNAIAFVLLLTVGGVLLLRRHVPAAPPPAGSMP